MNPFTPFPPFGICSGPATPTVPTVTTLFTGGNKFAVGFLNDAVNTSATYRRRIAVFRKVTTVRAIFASSAMFTGNVEASPSNSLTVGFSIVVNGVRTPFTFGGSPTGTMAPGTILQSDEMTVTVDPEITPYIYEDSYVSVIGTPADTTKLWPHTSYLYNELSEGRTFGENRTTAGSPAPDLVSLGAAIQGFSPVALIGRQAEGQAAVASIGDSIAFGQGDVSGVDQSTVLGRGDWGFIKRALDREKIPYVSFARGGDRASAYPNRTITPALIELCKCNVAVDEYNVNDIFDGATLATLKTLATARWSSLRAGGVSKIFATTLVPASTSTDYWITTANQTRAGGFTVNGVRQQWNDWLRGGNDGLADGFFDVVTGTVETGLNSGLWVPSVTPVTGTTASATSTTLTAAGAAWTPGQWQDYAIQITGGTGFPQTDPTPKALMSNTSNVLTLIPGQSFAPAINATTTWRLLKSMVYDGLHPASVAAGLMSTRISPVLINGSVGGYDADALAYIARVEAARPAITMAQGAAIDAWFKACKAAGWWSLLGRLHLPIWGNATANAICLRSLTSGTWTGGPTQGAGWVQGNGSSQRFNMGASMVDIGATTTDGSIGFIIAPGGPDITSMSSFATVMGARAADNTGFVGAYRNGGTGLSFPYGASSGSPSASIATASARVYLLSKTSGQGLRIHTRDASGATAATGSAATSASLSTRPMHVMCNIQGTSYFDYSTFRLGAFWMGHGFTDEQAADFTLSMKTLWETCTSLTLP